MLYQMNCKGSFHWMVILQTQGWIHDKSAGLWIIFTSILKNDGVFRQKKLTILRKIFEKNDYYKFITQPTRVQGPFGPLIQSSSVSQSKQCPSSHMLNNIVHNIVLYDIIDSVSESHMAIKCNRQDLDDQTSYSGSGKEWRGESMGSILAQDVMLWVVIDGLQNEHVGFT